MKQDATFPDEGLTEQQIEVIGLICAGETDTSAAAAVGVDRVTIWRWRQDPAFQASLNLKRQELWAGHSDRLRSLVPLALDVIEKSLSDGDTTTAWRIVKAAGLDLVGVPAGETDLDALERERRSKAADAKQSERMLELSEMMAGI